MTDIKLKKNYSTIQALVLVFFLLIVGYLAYKGVNDYTRKKQLHQVLIFQSDSIDLDYHDQVLLNLYLQSLSKYNLLAEKVWLKSGVNPKKVTTPSNAKEANAALLLITVKHIEEKLKASKILKEIGFRNEDIHAMQDENITAGVLIEARELKNYATLLKDKNVSVGSRPEEIWVVQRLLNYQDYNIPIDGIYNSIMDNAVSDFQRKSNLFVSHRVDNFTLEKLTEQ